MSRYRKMYDAKSLSLTVRRTVCCVASASFTATMCLQYGVSILSREAKLRQLQKPAKTEYVAVSPLTTWQRRPQASATISTT